MSRVLRIQPGESAGYEFEMLPYIGRSGDPVTSVGSITATDQYGNAALTFTAISFSGTIVSAVISGAIDGGVYNIVVTFSTALSPVLMPDFTLVGRETK